VNLARLLIRYDGFPGAEEPPVWTWPKTLLPLGSHAVTSFARSAPGFSGLRVTAQAMAWRPIAVGSGF